MSCDYSNSTGHNSREELASNGARGSMVLVLGSLLNLDVGATPRLISRRCKIEN